MIFPTPEEVLAAKAEASTRFGRPEVLLIPVTAPIDFCVLMAPFDLESYCAKADADSADQETSLRNTVHKHRLWPAVELVTARLERRPAMAGKVVERMMIRAGRLPGQPAVELLEDVLARTAAADEVIPGLSRAAAEKLLADNAGAELWAVAGPGPLSVVLQTPDGEVWLAARAAGNKALLADKRVVRAKLDFVLQAVKWSARPLEGDLLDDLPVLSTDLRQAYDLIGGDGASATSKSL